MKAEVNVKLLAHTPMPEDVVSMGAKLCYSPLGIDDLENKTTEDDNGKFIKTLSSMGHLSPIEHATFTFGIEGVSRSLTHQLVRSRIASFSQKSQRYVKEGQFEYIVPKTIDKNKKAKRLYIQHMEYTQAIYDKLIETLESEGFTEKQAIENARYVLPNATETKIIVTMNARSLIHFFELRTCNRAQQEIKELADEMYWLCVDVAPNIFSNQVASCISKGKCSEGKMSCKNPRVDLKIK